MKIGGNKLNERVKSCKTTNHLLIFKQSRRIQNSLPFLDLEFQLNFLSGVTLRCFLKTKYMIGSSKTNYFHSGRLLQANTVIRWINLTFPV